MTIVYLNGEFIQQEQATVSIMDRGFLFGDGVYESLPVYQGHIFGLKQHLERLDQGLSAIKMAPPLAHRQWEDVLHELLVLNGKQHCDQSIYVQVTRGSAPVRNHAFPEEIKPTILALCMPPKDISQETLHRGFSAITLEDRRRQDCNIKALNLLPNILAYQQAHEANSAEAIFIRNGEALEGTSSNLFIVKNDTIYTPPVSPNILAGVTRELILHLAKENNLSCEEKSVKEKMLLSADEIWLTGSLKAIYPIVKLNDNLVGNGQVGPMWFTITNLYANMVNAAKNNTDTKQFEQPEDRL